MINIIDSKQKDIIISSLKLNDYEDNIKQIIRNKLLSLNKEIEIWQDDKENVLVYDGERTAIIPPIKSGEKRAVKMHVKIPQQLQQGKTYRIVCTLVAEFHFWFDQNGENLKNINLTVTD